MCIKLVFTIGVSVTNADKNLFKHKNNKVVNYFNPNCF